MIFHKFRNETKLRAPDSLSSFMNSSHPLPVGTGIATSRMVISNGNFESNRPIQMVNCAECYSYKKAEIDYLFELKCWPVAMRW